MKFRLWLFKKVMYLYIKLHKFICYLQLFSSPVRQDIFFLYSLICDSDYFYYVVANYQIKYIINEIIMHII